MDMQAFVDGISRAGRLSRQGYHLKLGALLSALKEASDQLPVEFDHGGYPGEPRSYRGYYEDLAFAPSDEYLDVGKFRVIAATALGSVFEGYKGGEYRMGEDTPLWEAHYGTSSGRAIIGCRADEQRGIFLLITQVVE